MSQVAASGHAVPGLQLEEGKVGSRAGSRLEERQSRQIKALGEAPLSLGDWQAGSGLAKKMGVTTHHAVLCFILTQVQQCPRSGLAKEDGGHPDD